MKTLLFILFFTISIFPISTHSKIEYAIPSKSLAITNATVIDGTNSPPKFKMTVLIQNGRIKNLGKTKKINIPKNSKIINAKGKFLIPAFWDMHVHTLYKGIPELAFPLLIANGVTTIRDMNGTLSFTEINKLRNEIARGQTLGPRIFAAGKLIDGPRLANALGPNIISVKSEEEAREAVRSLIKQGADFIKIYNRITPELLSAIANESKKQKIPFVGHTPHQVRAEQVSSYGQKSIEHLSGVLEGTAISEKELINITKTNLSKEKPTRQDFLQVINARKKIVDDYNENKAEKLFNDFAKNDTWQTPTLISNKILSLPANDDYLLKNPLLKYVSPEIEKQWTNNGIGRQLQFGIMNKRFPKLLEIVRKMKLAKVKFLAGTDTGVPYVFPGFSLHDELELFVKAGFTPLEALQTATRNPAEFMDKTDSLGTIKKDKLTDMILLDANPLENIRNTRKISGVIIKGKYLDKTDLNNLLAKAQR